MIEFTKMHGIGNDYIYINQLNDKNFIRNIGPFTRYICDRHFGVGADGIILIKKSNLADVKMEIYNSDGSQAQMCGNGIRCLGKYIFDNNFIKSDELKVETLAGIKQLKLHIKNNNVEEVTVNMGRAKFNNNIKIKISDKEFDGTAISMGNPHFVILTKNVENVDVCKYGSIIEKYKIFPEKTNVEFAEIVGNTSIKMRVWERGSGETLACGTGACATFAVCNRQNLVKDKATIYLAGGSLKINIDNINENIYMTGIATKICDGKIENPLVF